MTEYDRACPACGRRMQRCVECDVEIQPNRPEARYCGSNCRVKRHRRLKKENQK